MSITTSERVFENESSSSSGVWIGIDFGTCNCACAVWDSQGGRAKLMRIGTKRGRIVPSAAVLEYHKDKSDGSIKVHDIIPNTAPHNEYLSALVGQAAMNVEKEAFTILTRVKRILGMTRRDLQAPHNHDLFQSLPFECATSNENDEIYIKATPLTNDMVPHQVWIKPEQVAAIILRFIQQQAQVYLDREGCQKQLQVPCDDTNNKIDNVVIGVPAHFTQCKRNLLIKACRLAGFLKGHVSTVTESTAAAMAYGLFVASSFETKRHILVFDMGGGTTDVTIAELTREESGSSPAFSVLVTEGDGQLGGTDMDQIMMELVLQKINTTLKDFTTQQQQALLQKCQQAKEELCGNGTNNVHVRVTVSVDKQHPNITVTMDEFNQAIQPLVDRAQSLIVDKALKQMLEQNETDINLTNSNFPTRCIDEVVLVGGATRVPLVRQMLRGLFPHVELCCSLNPEGAVAQGAAIQAAIRSNLVPRHELRSAMMLDSLPHAIGVLVKTHDKKQHFVEILQKDMALPAMGHATFRLANANQPGVTVQAVEYIPDAPSHEQQYQPMGSFSFLLKRLSVQQLESIGKDRSVDIGMTLETSGKFVVSIFDWNDPEHLAKKQRYQEEKRQQEGGATDCLGYKDNQQACQCVGKLQEETNTMEQILLMIACVVLFIAYIAVKLAFSEPPEETARIL